MIVAAVICDLDDTLVDTACLREKREARAWKAAVRDVGSTRLFTGIAPMMDGLRKRGLKIGVVTTSVSYYAEAVLAHHGLIYDTLVCYHDAPAKPSAAPCELAARWLEVPVARVIGLGDLEKDFLSYRAAGVRAVFAGWSGGAEDLDWDDHAETPSDFLDIIDMFTPGAPR